MTPTRRKRIRAVFFDSHVLAINIRRTDRDVHRSLGDVERWLRVGLSPLLLDELRSLLAVK